MKDVEELFNLFADLIIEKDKFYNKISQGLILVQYEYLDYLYSIQDERMMSALKFIEAHYDEHSQREIVKEWMAYKALELQKLLNNTVDINKKFSLRNEISTMCNILTRVDKVIIGQWYEVNSIFDLSYIEGIEKLYSQKQNVLFSVFKSYFNYFQWVLEKPFYYKVDNINKIYREYDLTREKNYRKYKLVNVSPYRELLDLSPPRIYDKIIDKTIYIENVCYELVYELKKLYEDGLIQELSFRLKNTGFKQGKNESNYFTEAVEFGKVFDYNILGGEALISKLYSESVNDALWINIDSENITFEEIKEDFFCSKDMIMTQVFHFQYKKGINKCYLTHFDHEYVFYTLEEYEIRCKEAKQKGKAQKRLKSFKADKCLIPIDYSIEYKKSILDNNMQISEETSKVCLLYFVLSCYFEHTDLLNEYLEKII